MLKRYLLALGVMIALFPVATSQAQSQSCNNVDLSTVAALVFQAQTGFSSGDHNTGLDRLAQAQALISVIQSNCGDNRASVAPTAIPQSTQPAPQSTEPTTATPAPIIEGDQVYNAPDGLFSVTFPASWVSSAGDRSLLIGTSQEALVSLTLVSNPLASGERGATILVNHADVLVPNAETTDQIIDFYQRMFNSDLSVAVGTPQPITVDERAGQGFRYTTEEYSGFFLVVPLDEEEMLVLFAIAPLGEDVTLPTEAIEIAKQVRLGVTEVD
jgi:hypothetical protein